MNRNYVEYFNRKVLGIEPRQIGLMDPMEFKLSMTQLREEIREMEEAYEHGDLIAVVDGMVDLDYFLKGVVYKHGIMAPIYNEIFKVVHDANMQKKLGVKSGREGFDGAADAVKPAGWVAPEEKIGLILSTSAWKP